MDEFAKQNVAQDKYKKLRQVPKKEYHGDFKSPHYKEVENAAATQTELITKEEFRSDYKDDFDKAARDFWQHNTQTGLSKYNGGSVSANFGTENYTLDEFLARLSNFVKETITNELNANKIPTENLTENFKAVDVSLKLLAKSVEGLDPNISIISIGAYMQGFINTYVQTMVNKKLERDKGQVKS